MNENYLHFLWKNKRIPFSNLQTIDGKQVEILQVGIHNLDSGPDFFNGKIRIDQITHSGNIEMHVRSSDWNLHGHQFDKAYSNVILHVVYEHDQLIFIEGIPVPTVELKKWIDSDHFRWFTNYYKGNETILCGSFLKHVPKPVVLNQLEKAVFQRLNRKMQELDEWHQNGKTGFKEVLFQVLSKAFGMKVNQLPFQQLALGIPFNQFIKASHKQKMALTFGVGGFLEEENLTDSYQKELKQEWDFQRYKLKLRAANKHAWKFKGCRPGGFPTQRLAQFASFVHEMNWDSDIWYLPAKELLSIIHTKLLQPADEYWLTHFDFDKEKKVPSNMSPATANTIIINSVVPFLWWLTEKLSDNSYRERAFEILQLLPPEKNEKVNEWKGFGVIPVNALESQALLELTNEFCLKKACLKCAIGNAVLK